MRKAIIGGTGVYDAFENFKPESILTAYGEVDYDLVEINGQEIVFLARHGKIHNTPPHKINYLANMMALKMLDVTDIYATCAVGSMNLNYSPGQVVLMTDFLDFTKNRIQTYFDGGDMRVGHVEMTDPYCSKLRKLFVDKCSDKNIDYKGEAVYVCTEGPRFETAAEIKMFSQLGGDVVGMTNVPECVLAKELGMCYSAVGVITNWCTGIEMEAINGHLIEESMQKNKEILTELFVDILVESIPIENCKCNQSMIIL